jgi:alpha-1,3-fucosyltransferase 10
MGDVLSDMEAAASDTGCLHFQVVVELGKFERKKLKDSNVQDGHRDVEGEPKHLEPFPEKEALALAGRTKVDAGSYPIVLWWSPLTGETGRLGQCGADACFFTINRTFQHHPMTRAFLFYGELGFPSSFHVLMSVQSLLLIS